MQDIQLKKKFAFWFSASQDSNTDNFQEQIKRIGTVQSARDFWGYYSYMVKPDKLPEGAQFFLFQDNITPVWEDQNNQNGGRFILRVRRGWENKIWEELLLSYITDDNQHLDYICGIIAHSKRNFILFSIWVKDLSKTQKSYDEIQKWAINAVGLQNKVDLEYIPHPHTQTK